MSETELWGIAQWPSKLSIFNGHVTPLASYFQPPNTLYTPAFAAMSTTMVDHMSSMATTISTRLFLLVLYHPRTPWSSFFLSRFMFLNVFLFSRVFCCIATNMAVFYATLRCKMLASFWVLPSNRSFRAARVSCPSPCLFSVFYLVASRPRRLYESPSESGEADVDRFYKGVPLYQSLSFWVGSHAWTWVFVGSAMKNWEVV